MWTVQSFGLQPTKNGRPRIIWTVCKSGRPTKVDEKTGRPFWMKLDGPKSKFTFGGATVNFKECPVLPLWIVHFRLKFKVSKDITQRLYNVIWLRNINFVIMSIPLIATCSFSTSLAACRFSIWSALLWRLSSSFRLLCLRSSAGSFCKRPLHSRYVIIT